MKKKPTFATGDTSSILNNLNTAVYRTSMDSTGSFIDINPAFLKVFGYEPGTEIEDLSVVDLYADPADRKAIIDELNARGFLRDREVLLKRKNGEVFTGRISSVLITDDAGNALYSDGVIDDISAALASQQKIAESELRYRLLVENSPTGILRIDLRGNITDVNQRMLDILGSPAAKKTKSINVFTFKPLVDAGISQKYQEAILDKKTVHFSGEYITNWGKTIYFQSVIIPVFDTAGEITGAQANTEDVTSAYLADQSRIELERTQLEERNIFMAGPIMIFKWDIKAENPLLHTSENVKEILGYSVKDFLMGRVIFSDIIHPEDIDRVKATSKKAIDQGVGAFDTSAYRLRRKNGTYLWVNDHSTIIRDEKGDIKNISGIVYDITHMIETEEALKLTEQTYEELFNAISEAIFVHDPHSFEILDVNETMLKMYGYKRKEVIGSNVQKFSYNKSVMPEVSKFFERAKTGKREIFEWEARHKNGHKFWVEVALRSATIHGKKKILANVRDISDRKQILSELEASLREQEVLLREVHHRVKNNMQVIISLLNLQAEYSQDEHLFEIFGETRNRIRTMALIHEKLFRSESMSAVDFGNYIKSLIGELLNFYSIDAKRVHIHQKIGDMKLDISKAIPCGLIVNELISNALKYAFPKKREGDLWLSVKAVRAKTAEIQVKDNGIGLDPSLDFETTQTMGLRIVRLLTEQLDGSMEISGNKGSCFTLRFDLLDEND